MPMPLSSVLQAFKPKSKLPPARKVRVGLIGAGRMGQLHARLLSENPGVEFVGVVDADPAKGHSLAKKYRTQAFSQAKDLIGRAEAAIVAVPTQLHFELGQLLLNEGLHCLIEKPFTS